MVIYEYLYYNLKFQTKTDCPSDWTYVQNVGCYFVGSGLKMSFQSAVTYCKNKGGIIVEPTNSLEQSALANLMGGYFWIGATDADSEGNFKWMSGTPWTFSNWNTGMLNSSN